MNFSTHLIPSAVYFSLLVVAINSLFKSKETHLNLRALYITLAVYMAIITFSALEQCNKENAQCHAFLFMAATTGVVLASLSAHSYKEGNNNLNTPIILGATISLATFMCIQMIFSACDIFGLVSTEISDSSAKQKGTNAINAKS